MLLEIRTDILKANLIRTIIVSIDKFNKKNKIINPSRLKLD